jgi:hypothetical protein
MRGALTSRGRSLLLQIAQSARRTRMSVATTTRPRAGHVDRRWWALALLAMAEFVVVLDASIVNIALPSIGRGLHFSLTGLSWVVNAYVLTFGGFLLLGGRIADLVGRRRVFMIGLGVFALASLAGGLAEPRVADRRPRGAGTRRGPHGSGRALARHRHLPRGVRTQPSSFGVGGGGRLGRRRRRTAGRRADQRPRLALGAVRQRPDRDRRCPPDPVADRREPR